MTDRFDGTWSIVVFTINVDGIPRVVIKPFSVDIVYIFLIAVVLKMVVGPRNRNTSLLRTGAYDICPSAAPLGLEGLVLVMAVGCESRRCGVCNYIDWECGWRRWYLGWNIWNCNWSSIG